MRGQACGCVCTVLDDATHNEAVIVVKRIGGRVCVVLLLIVAPAVVAKLMAEVLRNRCCSVK